MSKRGAENGAGVGAATKKAKTSGKKAWNEQASELIKAADNPEALGALKQQLKALTAELENQIAAVDQAAKASALDYTGDGAATCTNCDNNVDPNGDYGQCCGGSRCNDDYLCADCWVECSSCEGKFCDSCVFSGGCVMCHKKLCRSCGTECERCNEIVCNSRECRGDTDGGRSVTCRSCTEEFSAW